MSWSTWKSGFSLVLFLPSHRKKEENQGPDCNLGQRIRRIVRASGEEGWWRSGGIMG